jgi:hypothetical protein
LPYSVDDGKKIFEINSTGYQILYSAQALLPVKSRKKGW